MCRHGARLDAADKQWHLTSPTPYDPPLTYGGWTQARALGARIASLLQAREETHEESLRPGAPNGHAEVNGHNHKHSKGRRRKHRVVLYSSPFIRCVQTAVAVSAGMAQYHKTTPGPLSSNKHSHLRSGSPHPPGTDRSKSPHLSSIPEPDEDPTRSLQLKQLSTAKFEKSRLRVDAFLGEWLSPDYFENITAPPSSVMMVATAKADLLRRAEALEGSEIMTKPLQGHFPGGWGSDYSDSTSATEEEDEVTGLANMANLGHSLPRRVIRSSSHGDGGGPVRQVARVAPKVSTKVGADPPAYVPPVPSYAISPSDPIPTGYVAHARDACVNVDLQWDSMRAPQDWGDGGEYGEEWSGMHKRFRSGLQKMLAWYKTRDDKDPAIDDDEDTDIVLVLVTHGAGCNALIGAMTNQPVLLDVGMASLTMAVRKDIIEGSEAKTSELQPMVSPMLTRTTSSDPSIASEYDVKLVASTEHLRAGSNPLSAPQLQPPRTQSPGGFGSHRPRFSSVSSESSSLGDMTAARGSNGLHRSSSAASASRTYPVSAPIRSGSGLWGSSTPTSESSDDIVPNFSAGDVTHIAEAVKRAEKSNGEVDSGPLPTTGLSRTPSQRGLWGAAGSPRSRSPVPSRADLPQAKRRWTVNEH